MTAVRLGASPRDEPSDAALTNHGGAGEAERKGADLTHAAKLQLLMPFRAAPPSSAPPREANDGRARWVGRQITGSEEST